MACYLTFPPVGPRCVHWLGKGRAQYECLFLHPPRLEPCIRFITVHGSALADPSSSWSCDETGKELEVLQMIRTDRKYKRPFHPCPPAARRRQLLLARGAGGVLSALSVTRSSGAQQGVAWFCGSLDMRLRRE